MYILIKKKKTFTSLEKGSKGKEVFFFFFFFFWYLIWVEENEREKSKEEFSFLLKSETVSTINIILFDLQALRQ
jgi:hypothetical protein